MSEDRIVHSKDPRLAQLNELSTAAGRRTRSQFLAEGVLIVRRAIDDRLPIDWLACTSDLIKSPDGESLLQKARDAGISVVFASEGLLAKVTTTRPVPDVMAPITVGSIEEVVGCDMSLHTILVAENINNPDNLGMIIRTADAAGAQQVVTAGCDPFHKSCVRAARGAVGRLAIHTCSDLPAYLRFAAQQGAQVVGTALDAEFDLYGAEIKPRVVVVVGNENSGITRESLDACTLRVRIPMASGQDSLNVGVAAGVVLYEILRRRLQQ